MNVLKAFNNIFSVKSWKAWLLAALQWIIPNHVKRIALLYGMYCHLIGKYHNSPNEVAQLNKTLMLAHSINDSESLVISGYIAKAFWDTVPKEMLLTCDDEKLLELVYRAPLGLRYGRCTDIVDDLKALRGYYIDRVAKPA